MSQQCPFGLEPVKNIRISSGPTTVEGDIILRENHVNGTIEDTVRELILNSKWLPHLSIDGHGFCRFVVHVMVIGGEDVTVTINNVPLKY